jgi:hypothetical protein
MEREFLPVCDGDHAITLLFSAALRPWTSCNLKQAAALSLEL